MFFRRFQLNDFWKCSPFRQMRCPFWERKQKNSRFQNSLFFRILKYNCLFPPVFSLNFQPFLAWKCSSKTGNQQEFPTFSALNVSFFPVTLFCFRFFSLCFDDYPGLHLSSIKTKILHLIRNFCFSEGASRNVRRRAPMDGPLNLLLFDRNSNRLLRQYHNGPLFLCQPVSLCHFVPSVPIFFQPTPHSVPHSSHVHMPRWCDSCLWSDCFRVPNTQQQSVSFPSSEPLLMFPAYSTQSICYLLNFFPVIGLAIAGPLLLEIGLDRFLAVTFPYKLVHPPFSSQEFSLRYRELQLQKLKYTSAHLAFPVLYTTSILYLGFKESNNEWVERFMSF